RERLEWLREMLRTIPKHKGTDLLQGDIKRRIKELSEELERPQRGGARGGPALVIRPEGAAQIALIGPPNASKSSLHARLTGSAAQAAPYPFTSQHPEPGTAKSSTPAWSTSSGSGPVCRVSRHGRPPSGPIFLRISSAVTVVIRSR